MNRRIRTTLSSSSKALTLEKQGISRWDVRDPYHFALTLGWGEFFAAVVIAYTLINLLFAAFYFGLAGSIANMPKGSFADAFFFSVETLATVGYGAMSPATTSGHLVATIEIFVGMMFTTTMTGLAFVRLSKPKAKIIFADKIVVTRQGGVPVLMVRFGNGRAYALTDAKVRIVVLLVEHAEDGQEYRRPVDLRLRRQELMFFPAMWTVMHDLDEASPLHGITQENVGGKGLRIMLSLVARDPQLGAEVHALQTYDGSDIAFGMRYAEAVSWDSAHSSVADMRKISSIEAEMPAGPPPSVSSVAPS